MKQFLKKLGVIYLVWLFTTLVVLASWNLIIADDFKVNTFDFNEASSVALTIMVAVLLTNIIRLAWGYDADE